MEVTKDSDQVFIYLIVKPEFHDELFVELIVNKSNMTSNEYSKIASSGITQSLALYNVKINSILLNNPKILEKDDPSGIMVYGSMEPILNAWAESIANSRLMFRINNVVHHFQSESFMDKLIKNGGKDFEQEIGNR